jgi:hypothetical protein
MRNKKRSTWILSAVCVLGTLAGLRWLGSAASSGPPAEPSVATPTPYVVTHPDPWPTVAAIRTELAATRVAVRYTAPAPPRHIQSCYTLGSEPFFQLVCR